VKIDPKRARQKDMDPLRYVGPVRTESFLVEGIEVGEKKGRRISYSFLEKSEIEGARFPQLIKVYTDVFQHGDHTIVFYYRSESSHFEEGLPQYNKILSSVTWRE
jgi:hypothetical protein